LRFDSVWVPEHHFATPGIIGNPLLLATAISQRTTRIKIGTAAVVLPFQHPLRIAEDAALSDVLSDGRLMLGVGRGWQVPEFEVFQIDQTASKDMFAEGMEILQKAWTEETFSYDGKFWSFKDVSVFPSPFSSRSRPSTRPWLRQVRMSARGPRTCR
jgi:alkanesulfonate monooxygenase SsuD/methylene tetrahydromethanopterin reductase-like flavin-dependent oxidoreductase (luciferase family)